MEHMVACYGRHDGDNVSRERDSGVVEGTYQVLISTGSLFILGLTLGNLVGGTRLDRAKITLLN